MECSERGSQHCFAGILAATEKILSLCAVLADLPLPRLLFLRALATLDGFEAVFQASFNLVAETESVPNWFSGDRL